MKNKIKVKTKINYVSENGKNVEKGTIFTYEDGMFISGNIYFYPDFIKANPDIFERVHG